MFAVMAGFAAFILLKVFREKSIDRKGNSATLIVFTGILTGLVFGIPYVLFFWKEKTEGNSFGIILLSMVIFGYIGFILSGILQKRKSDKKQ